MKNYIICILIIAGMLIPISADSNILTDKLLEGVEDVISKEVKKIENKIDEFIEAETNKVRNKAIQTFMICLLLSAVYSTILIFATRRYLSKK